MVVWLLGISGSGKSTLARELKKVFDEKGLKSFIVDGDYVRDFFDRDLGYSKEERIENIKRVLIAVKVLSDSGIVPIVANISPFQSLREFARKKLRGYVEVYLKRDLDKIRGKDDVYKSSHVVGVDVEFDEPKNADLVLDTGRLSVDECVGRIMETIDDR